tara:strand:+ start:114 stop:779 length:666 start_codon:yes stop_codon:yes gene_type:complete
MKTYGEYLQFLKDNPEKAKEMSDNKTLLIYSLFYPVALELNNIPLYAPTLPLKIKKLLNISLDESISLTKDIYKSQWPKSKEEILKYLSRDYKLENTSSFLKLGLDKIIYNQFSLEQEIDLNENNKKIILPNLYAENNLKFIKSLSSHIERELSLPKDYTLNNSINYLKERRGFTYLRENEEPKEEALAKALYSFFFRIFKEDKLFLDNLFKYQDSLKLAS